MLPHQFSMMYIRNNKQFLFFLIFFIILINATQFFDEILQCKVEI